MIILAVGVLLTVSAQAQSLSKQYCNPLPMEIGPYRYAGNNPLLRKIVKLTVTGSQTFRLTNLCKYVNRLFPILGI